MHDWLTSLGETADIWIGLNDRASNGHEEGDFVWTEYPDVIFYDDGETTTDPPHTVGGDTTYWWVIYDETNDIGVEKESESKFKDSKRGIASR